MLESYKSENYQESSEFNPCRNLIAAVLARALDDLKFNVKTKKSDVPISLYDAQNSIQWIFSSSEEIFSFNYCCQQIDLNAKEMRKLLYEHCRSSVVGIRFTVSENFDFKEFESKQMDLFSVLS